MESDVSSDVASAHAVQVVCIGRRGIGDGILEVLTGHIFGAGGAFFGVGTVDLEIWPGVCSCSWGDVPFAFVLDMDCVSGGIRDFAVDGEKEIGQKKIIFLRSSLV